LAEKAAKGLQRKGRQMDPNETQVALPKKIQNRTNQPTITEKRAVWNDRHENRFWRTMEKQACIGKRTRISENGLTDKDGAA